MDAAFKSAPYPAWTTKQLRIMIAEERDPSKINAMQREVERRAKVAAGDMLAMTPAERLRHIRAQEG